MPVVVIAGGFTQDTRASRLIRPAATVRRYYQIA
jgi:hypothetical protein